MVDVYLGLKIPNIINITIVEQDLMLMGDMDIGIILDTIPTINQVDVVYFRVYHFLFVLLMKIFMVKR